MSKIGCPQHDVFLQVNNHITDKTYIIFEKNTQKSWD